MGDIIADREKFQRGWTGGLPETPCGAGSKVDQTETQRKWIPRMVGKYGIKSIADIGAGDLNWVSLITWPREVCYWAYDLVPRHKSVQAFDLLIQRPPCVDLLMCLWVLNHLPFAECQAALANIRASGSRYLMLTDRPKWHHEQPPEIQMPYLEELLLRAETGDRLLLVDLQC